MLPPPPLLLSIGNGGLRRRHHNEVVYSSIATFDTPTSIRAQQRALHVTPAVTFLAAMLTFTLTGVLASLTPPQATTQFEMDESFACLRAHRGPDFTTAVVVLGTPPRLLSVLVRFDRAVNSSVDPALRIFSSQIAESSSFSCENNICHDVAITSVGINGRSIRQVIEFRYTAPVIESTATSNTAYSLGFDGEVFLRHDHEYILTASHFCATPLSTSDDGGLGTDEAVPIELVNNQLLTTRADQVTQLEQVRETPAIQALVEGRCSIDVVDLFPPEAAIEAQFLALSSSSTSLQNVESRRVVIEVGTNCAAAHSFYSRAYSLLQLDCLNCLSDASIPYRRFAHNSMRLRLTTSSGYLWLQHDDRLDAIPTTETGVGRSILKLMLMVLAAAVTWVRASKHTAAHDLLYLHCLRIVRCEQKAETTTRARIFEDAAIGITAVAARFAIAIWRCSTLGGDDQLRAPSVQLVASVVSFVQWLVRYFVLKRSECEQPLTKLGGSTALVDATCAVMLAFAEPPLLQSNNQRFDPTARLLTALLLTTMTLQRILFASACCGLLLSVEWQGRHTTYTGIVVAATASWLFQACSVAVLIVDVFATPLSWSLHRASTGGYEVSIIAVFLATTCAGLPQLFRTSLRLLEE